MRVFPFVAMLVLLAPLATGCAHTLESREDRVVVAVDTKPTMDLTEPPPVLSPPPNEAVVTRPRLSRTVTLGEGAPEAYVPAPQAAPASAFGPNVVVNNNITVVGGAPPVVYGGGYAGYGYGDGYGGGRSGGHTDPSSRGTSTRSNAWAPNGWEGAGRTAPPGQTPHVGGNWAPAPSSGPRQLK